MKRGVKIMEQINTKKFANDFCNMINSIFNKFKYVGDWNWGNPEGQVKGLSTYEVISDKYGTVYGVHL